MAVVGELAAFVLLAVSGGAILSWGAAELVATWRELARPRRRKRAKGAASSPRRPSQKRPAGR